MEEHPLDPGWEEGSYVCCHKNIRRLTEIGTRIIDVVTNEKRKPIVRSAFLVSRAEGTGYSRELFFDEFYFASDDPIELPGLYIQYRQMKMQAFVRNYPDEPPLWERIERTYTKYKKGVRPESIDLESWTKMKEIAARVKEKHKYEGIAEKEKRICR